MFRIAYTIVVFAIQNSSYLISRSAVLIGTIFLAFFVFFITPFSTHAAIVNFDDLSRTYRSSSPIPTSYGGLNWSGFRYTTTADYSTIPSGRSVAATSLPNAIFYDAVISPHAISSLENFDLISAKLTSVWKDNLQVNARGYSDGVLKYNNTYTLSATTPVQIDFNFTGINRVEFVPSGGVQHYAFIPNPADATDFYIDDLTYSVNNCVKLELDIGGNGPKKIVFMRGDGWNSSVNDFLSNAKIIRDRLLTIEPFETYQGQFSFYADLKKHSQSSSFTGSSDFVKSQSSCGTDGFTYVYFFQDANREAWSIQGKGVSFLDYPHFVEDPLDVIHEMGHAIGNLDDEYYSSTYTPAFPPEETNCASDPFDTYRNPVTNRMYGAAQQVGCYYKNDTYYRANDESLMGNNYDSSKIDIPANKFNVPSCARLVVAIKGETPTKANAAQYWPECFVLDTAKNSIPPILPAPIISSITGGPPGGMATMKGSGFTQTGNSVQFISPVDGGIFETTNVPSSDGTTLTFTVPANLPTLSPSSSGYSFKAGALNSPWSNQLNLPSLPNLGMYREKFSKLQTSILVAIDSLKKKQTAALANLKAGEVQRGNPQIDVPLQLLTRMKKNLETDANGSLKDQAGMVRFFTYFKSLSNYTDLALAEVFLRTNELAGFSYLFPPSPDKPILISLPGSGGEGGWRGSFELLQGEASKFNIVVYTYDSATLTSGEMTDIFIAKFVSNKLHERNPVIVSLSMGSTLIHSAILRDVSGGSSVFSNSYVVSTGLLPGGAAEFLGWMKIFVPLAPYAYPISRGTINVMNPTNPIYVDIANNMPRIASKTKGISYIQAQFDHHTDPEVQGTTYASNRDKTLAGMADVVNVVPPKKYINNKNQIEQNNDHINLLYATEVKNKISYYRNLLENSSPLNAKELPIASGRSISRWLMGIVQNLGAHLSLDKHVLVASAQSPEDPNFIPSFFGGPDQDICEVAADILEDALIIPEMDYDIYVSKLAEYMLLTEATCSIEDESEEAFSDLEILPVSESVAVSGTEIYAVDLDLSGISGIDLVVDGTVVSTDSSGPWNLSFASTNFSNGIHTVYAVIRTSSGASLNTKSVPITINNSTSLYSLLIDDSETGTVKCNNVSCPATVAQGSQVTLTAHPDSGFVFSAWTVSPSLPGTCAGILSGTLSCTFTMDSNKTVGARFVPAGTGVSNPPQNPPVEPAPILNKVAPQFISGSYRPRYVAGTTNQSVVMGFVYPSPTFPIARTVEIERSDSSQPVFQKVGEVALSSGITSDSYEDKTIVPTHAYTYRLRALYSDGSYSNYSLPISVMTYPHPTEAPTLYLRAESDSRMSLYWTIPTTEGIKSYTILDKANNPPLVQNISPTTSDYSITGLKSDTRYCYILQPIAIYGTGFYGGAPPSSSVCTKTLKVGETAPLPQGPGPDPRERSVSVGISGGAEGTHYSPYDIMHISFSASEGVENVIISVGNQQFTLLVPAGGSGTFDWTIPETFQPGNYMLSAVPQGGGNTTIVPFVIVGQAAGEGQQNQNPAINNPVSSNDVYQFLATALKTLVKILLPVIVIFYVVVGLMFILARGDSEKLALAKMAFLYTTIGTGIVLSAWLLADVIKNTINVISS
ncbi:MAG: hypothetical protein A2664_02130 [Candidatus Taylorbacteria bacterium RIFCSPHIGHO2_01_FULL_46_22b]|uniref:Fibronectin type-III domain-containing protein n=1 Tax=Candidatus Taylorbacteria bacterium RIFCSPHIGHO2_01_FULL_46_22b TaxID=1802301 RepID=A0A1G2M3A5_9BACT|nr:MAG: hypothetical protein A2664_02130 [Candidatus Taylorbacteria bacterium RIFCSPHIGHO2_01_FULL_46_22b]